MPAPRSTGSPRADAADDFLRARRREGVRRLARRIERGGDVDVILPFDEVVAELGRLGQVDLGPQVVELDSIIGTVDRTGNFDRAFRPMAGRLRGRWERIAEMKRRGEPLPPVSLYRVGVVHFVRDGHHRVSVARAFGETVIDAYVVKVQTRVGADRELRVSDLPVKGHERLFRERVPLPADEAAQVVLTDPWHYGALAEGVEAWGFRTMQDRAELLDREAVAALWFELEYLPTVEMLHEAGLAPAGATDADAYTELSAERYRLMRTQTWSDDVLARLRSERGRA